MSENKAAHPLMVATLFEGDYHLGVGALVNSLARAGFCGRVIAGFRGNLPPWTQRLTAVRENVYRVESGLDIEFRRLETKMHFCNLKPEFLLRLIEENTCPGGVCYFDPDITLTCSWSFVEMWAEAGVALCEEITNGTMPENHPLRQQWIKLARAAGWGETQRTLNRYYNSGFIAVRKEHRGLLEAWQRALQLAGSAGTDLEIFGPKTREWPFFASDQDALNLACMYSEVPLATIGPEGMGFVPGGFTMYHSVGAPKPWRKRFLRSALGGLPPWNGDKHFLEVADGPIPIYTRGQLKRKRLACQAASLIGRFYSRR